MVVKRIISCFAIIGAVVLMSCYDVQLDKEAAVNENWADGLETAVVIERMPVTVETVLSATKAESESTACK